MADLAYLWGFDEIAAYNIVPFEGSNPIRDIWPRMNVDIQCGDLEIQNAHERIAGDLKNADGFVVGWGTHGVPRMANRAPREAAFKTIKLHLSRELAPARLWHVGLNKNGSPKHAGARGSPRIPENARPSEFVFSFRGNSRLPTLI